MENWSSSRSLKRAEFFARTVALLSFLAFSCSTPADFSVYNYLSIQGANSTTGYNAVECGHANTSQANQFGQVYCFDMPLLAAHNLSSELLGQVQGTFAIVGLAAMGDIFVSETFTLNTPTQNGTFSGVGMEHVGNVSSKPIVGGTGDYNFTTGEAITTPLDTGTDSYGNFYSWFMYDFEFHS